MRMSAHDRPPLPARWWLRRRGRARDGARAATSRRAGKRLVERDDLSRAPAIRAVASSNSFVAAHLLELGGRVAAGWRADRRDRSLQRMRGHAAAPRRRAASIARSMRAEPRPVVGAKQRDDLFQQPAVATGVRQRRLLVEDRAGRLAGARRLGDRSPVALALRRRSARRSRSARRRRSAWAGSRPCPPRGSARDRPASRARSARRSGSAPARRALARADRLRRLEPAHLRHLHVHEHDVEAARAGAAERRRPPRGRSRRP